MKKTRAYINYRLSAQPVLDDVSICTSTLAADACSTMTLGIDHERRYGSGAQGDVIAPDVRRNDVSPMCFANELYDEFNTNQENEHTYEELN